MKIKITVFRENGEYYTDETVESLIDIPMWDDKFKEFIKENNPADIGEGYILTDNIDDTKKFYHCNLWKYNDIMG